MKWNHPVVRVAGIALLLLFFFVVGLILSFPGHAAKEAIEAQVEKALGFQWNVEIEELSLRGLTSVRMTDVRIISLSTPADGPPPLPVLLDEVRARVGLFSLLRGVPSGRVDIRIGDGTIRAGFGAGEEAAHLFRLTLDGVDLRQIPIIQQRLKVPIRGNARGMVELDYNEEMGLAGGRIDLGLEETLIGPANIESEALQPMPYFALPETDVGLVVIRGRIDGSEVTLTGVDADGSDVRVSVDGTVELRDPLAATQLRLTIWFDLDQGYVEEAGLGPILRSVPLFAQARGREGYTVALSGRLANLPPPQPLGGARGRPRRAPSESPEQ